MNFPGSGFYQPIDELIKKIIDSSEFKAELNRQVQLELDARANEYKGPRFGYSSLKRGSINTSNGKLGVRGTEVYGRTLVGNLPTTANTNVYRRMKNQVNYRNGKDNGTKSNNGSRTMI